MYTVSGPPYDSPRHAPIPASVPETKRVECSRDARRSARGHGPVARNVALTVAASGQTPVSRNLTIRKYSSGKRERVARGALAAARTVRRVRRHALSRRLSIHRHGGSALPGAISDSFLDALPSIPADPIDFLFTHGRRRNIGLTARSAAITTAEFIFSSRPETVMRTCARSPTRREVVPQWWDTTPSGGQARSDATRGPARSRPEIVGRFRRKSHIFSQRDRTLGCRTPDEFSEAKNLRLALSSKETWRTSRLHHPGASARR